jgi:hypothetical protein
MGLRRGVAGCNAILHAHSRARACRIRRVLVLALLRAPFLSALGRAKSQRGAGHPGPPSARARERSERRPRAGLLPASRDARAAANEHSERSSPKGDPTTREEATATDQGGDRERGAPTPPMEHKPDRQDRRSATSARGTEPTKAGACPP